MNYRVHQVTAYDSRVLVNKISWGVLKKARADREGIGWEVEGGGGGGEGSSASLNTLTQGTCPQVK